MTSKQWLTWQSNGGKVNVKVVMSPGSNMNIEFWHIVVELSDRSMKLSTNHPYMVFHANNAPGPNIKSHMAAKS